MLLQDCRGRQRALEAVGPILPHNAPKRVARFALELAVIWKGPQKLLNSLGRLVALYYLPFFPGEILLRRYLAGRSCSPSYAGAHLCFTGYRFSRRYTTASASVRGIGKLATRVNRFAFVLISCSTSRSTLATQSALSRPVRTST